MEANKPQPLPTLVTFEASSQEQEDEDLSSQDNANANKEEGEFEVTERSDKTTAVLLSEDELVDLLKKEAEEEQEAEERVLEEEEAETDKGRLESGEAVETIDDEEDNLHDKREMREDNKDVTDEEEEVKEESVGDAEMLAKEEVEMENMSRKEKDEKSEQVELLEETDGSTESEIPVDLDYAADSGILQPLQIVSAKLKPHTDDTQLSSNTDVKEKETGEKGLPTIDAVYIQDVQNTEAVDSEEVSDQDKDLRSKDVDEKEPVANAEPEEPKSNTAFESWPQLAGKEEAKNKNDSRGHTKGKTRKQKKNKRARKHSPQSEETQSGQEESQQDPQASDSSIDNTAQKAKRRRAGKWVMHT